MKRKIAVLLLALALLTALGMPAFASQVQETTTVDGEALHGRVSDDLQQIVIAGQTYVRADLSRLYDYNYSDISVELELTEQQKQTIKQAFVQNYVYDDEAVAVSVTFIYQDNATMTVYYINETVRSEYERLLQTDGVTVELWYPEGNEVDLSIATVKGQEEILFSDQLYSASEFFAVSENSDGLKVKRGAVLVLDDQYYYFDFDENGTTDIYDNERARAWLITDEATCAKLDAAMEAYYGEGFGIFEDEDFSEQVSRVFLIILFVFLPAAVLVVFLILAIRAKTPAYKKLFWNLCAWSALVLILVGLVVLVVELHG